MKSDRTFLSPGLLVGGIFIGIGAVFAITASSYDFGSAFQMGPGYFPCLVAAVLIGLGVIKLLISVTSFGSGSLPDVAWRPLLIVSAAVTLFAVTIGSVGLLPAIVVLIAVAQFAADRRSWGEVILLIFSLCVICTGIFSFLLGLPVKLVSL